MGAVVKARWGRASSFVRTYACLVLVFPRCIQRRGARICYLFYVVSASGSVCDDYGGLIASVLQFLTWYMELVFFKSFQHYELDGVEMRRLPQVRCIGHPQYGVEL